MAVATLEIILVNYVNPVQMTGDTIASLSVIENLNKGEKIRNEH